MRCFITTVFLLSLLTITSCSILSPVSPPAMKTYLLTMNDAVIQPSLSINATSHSQKVLLVSSISSPAWLNTAQMAYQMANTQLSYFARNQWAAPPADLLQPIVVQAIERAKLYRAVITPSTTGNYDQRLDIALLEMQQIFVPSSPVSSYAITLRVQLIDRYSNKIIASKQFHLVVPASQANPEAGVIAANQAVEQWLPQLLVFIHQYK